MLKIAKEWILSMDAVFTLVAGYSFIDLISIILLYNEMTSSSKFWSSLFVAAMAATYWIFRLIEFFSFKKLRREAEELKKINLEIRKEILEKEVKKLRDEEKLRDFELRYYQKYSDNQN